MKFTFIGAGSFIFTRRFVTDMMTYPALRECTLCLYDINEERLGFIKDGVRKILDAGGYPARVVSTLDRREALDCADAVIISILQGGIDVWRKDIEIPKAHGVDISVGDSMGPSGAFRALRTIPVFMDIARDMRELCPNALALNYTNPMSMLTGSLIRFGGINAVGLCHSVQGTSQMLAKWIGAQMSDISFLCAGINHQAWFLDFKWKGRDATGLIRDAILQNEGIYYREQVRNELFLKFGYYVTESSSHNSEYNPWFRKTPRDIETLCHNYETDEGYAHRAESVKYADLGWNYGRYANTLIYYQSREDKWRDYIRRQIEETPDLARGNEFAAPILNALFGDGELKEFNGNVVNRGLIDNLPNEACVEVPILASRWGLRPERVGSLPAAPAALNDINARCQQMIVEASATGNRELVYQAAALDPLTGASLNLPEIWEMIDDMFRANAEYLPQFRA